MNDLVMAAISELAGDCTDERRQQLMLFFFEMTNGNIYALATGLDMPKTSATFAIARDNLQALRGLITQMLIRYDIERPDYPPDFSERGHGHGFYSQNIQPRS